MKLQEYRWKLLITTIVSKQPLLINVICCRGFIKKIFVFSYGLCKKLNDALFVILQNMCKELITLSLSLLKLILKVIYDFLLNLFYVIFFINTGVSLS